MSVEEFDKNKKRKEEVSELLRENLIPRGKGVTITIEKLVVLVPTSGTAIELLTALRQVLKDC